MLKWLLLLRVGTTRRLHNDADAIALDFGSFGHIGEAENVLAPRAEQIRVEADGIGCNINPSTRALVVRAGVVPNNRSDRSAENCADNFGRVDIRRGRQFCRCSATGGGARSAGHTTGGIHILPVIRPAKI